MLPLPSPAGRSVSAMSAASGAGRGVGAAALASAVGGPGGFPVTSGAAATGGAGAPAGALQRVSSVASAISDAAGAHGVAASGAYGQGGGGGSGGGLVVGRSAAGGITMAASPGGGLRQLSVPPPEGMRQVSAASAASLPGMAGSRTQVGSCGAPMLLLYSRTPLSSTAIARRRTAHPDRHTLRALQQRRTLQRWQPLHPQPPRRVCLLLLRTRQQWGSW